MLSSLRARLLLWYTLILALVIATFAATLGYLYWRSLVDDIDQGLHASSAALVEGLRPTPWGDFDLVIPLEYRLLDANTFPSTYYAVWNNEGELIDRSTSEFEVASPADRHQPAAGNSLAGQAGAGGVRFVDAQRS
jgi:hypothetical protein